MRVLLVIVAWLAAHVTLIAASIAEVVVYSYVVAPGLPESAYHAHAEVSAPWVSIVLGGPVFYAIGRVLGRATGRPGSIWAVWALYTAFDGAVVLAVGGITPAFVAIWVLAQAAKAGGAALAARRG